MPDHFRTELELIKHGVTFNGYLLDINVVSVSVEVSSAPSQTFQFINPEFNVYVIFKNEQGILYSGECIIIRQTTGQKTRIFVLESVNDHLPRFKPKEYRSTRHKLLPSPQITFRHPFIQKTFSFEIDDLSGETPVLLLLPAKITTFGRTALYAVMAVAAKMILASFS